MIGAQVKGRRERHPLFDLDLDAPTILERADEVTIVVKRPDGSTITAVFAGERLETGFATTSEVDIDEDFLTQPRLDRPGPDRRYNLRLDLLHGATCTYTITNATEDPA